MSGTTQMAEITKTTPEQNRPMSWKRSTHSSTNAIMLRQNDSGRRLHQHSGSYRTWS